MQKGLVNKDLAFDTFLDAPPWNEAARIVQERRERHKQRLEGVNFEWIAGRAAAWTASHERELEPEGKPERAPREGVDSAQAREPVRLVCDSQTIDALA